MADLNDLEKGVWSSKLFLATKLRIYNVCVVAGLLYAAETWTLTVADMDRLDAFDTRCLRKILGIRWYDFILNVEVPQRTQQPLASLTLKACRQAMFGHTAHLDPSCDTRMALVGALAPPGDWRKPRGRPRGTWLSTVKNDLAPLNVGLADAICTARDREKWREITHQATL